MTPIDDPRPFAEVLRDWMARHKYTRDGAEAKLIWSRRSIGLALNGGNVRQERAMRALMTLIDEGRA